MKSVGGLQDCGSDPATPGSSLPPKKQALIWDVGCGASWVNAGSPRHHLEGQINGYFGGLGDSRSSGIFLELIQRKILLLSESM